jgi:hypothetical protein
LILSATLAVSSTLLSGKGILVISVHANMTGHMLKVGQTARLAQLRVDSLEFGSSCQSDAFKIGLWNWYCFFSPSGYRVVSSTV